MNINIPSFHIIESISNDFNNKKCSSYVQASPYPLVKVTNFLEQNFFQNVVNCANKIPLTIKKSDLYHFEQSKDLTNLLSCDSNKDFHFLSLLCKELYSEYFIEGFLQPILRKSLSKDKIDMSVQKYKPGHFLLCHDDRLDSRSVALMIYLNVDSWRPDYGGMLLRIQSDTRSLPCFSEDYVNKYDTISKNLTLPEKNSAAFFSVNATSYHLVTPLTPISPNRLSITCWFHSSPESIYFISPISFTNFANVNANYMYASIDAFQADKLFIHDHSYTTPYLISFSSPFHFHKPLKCDALIYVLASTIAKFKKGQYLRISCFGIPLDPFNENERLRLIYIPLFKNNE